MEPVPVIAVFDVGKTNKKLFLFDESYRIVYERSARFAETTDEDGFPCENLKNLESFLFESLAELSNLTEFTVKAVNFSAYGASLVFLDSAGKALTPLYNYLKPFPAEISRQLYDKYDGESQFAADTASPVSGSLNSGLVLYRVMKENPDVFKHLKYALHLPQYLSFLLTGHYYSDITSIGCHTALWDFNHNRYHNWVEQTGLTEKLAPTRQANETIDAVFRDDSYRVGVGLHDSSAALIPYLVSFSEPFLLISTGTWCISMNPFNQSVLTTAELQKECLCYLQYQGKPVKASRLFSGKEHDLQVKRIAAHFDQDFAAFRAMPFEPELIVQLQQTVRQSKLTGGFLKESGFKERDLTLFENEKEAYHQLILDLVHQQVLSTGLVLENTPVKRIFVDGGFSKNAVYMNLLAAAFPGIEVFAASMAQATAMGAALAIHDSWNTKPIPGDIIELKYYSQKFLL